MQQHIEMLIVVYFFIVEFICNIESAQLLWAVNCGGDSVVDSNGHHYEKDHLSVGFASDYGKSMIIQRSNEIDQILYQTERYHTGNFGYNVPIADDGNYVLLLKFSEVWFTAPNQKVFDVTLNGRHTIVQGLDIFGKVGRGVAHDEIIPFTVEGGKLIINGGAESSDIYGKKISIDFIKSDRDNPKINAILLFKGHPAEIPKLPDLVRPPQTPEDMKQHMEKLSESLEDGSEAPEPVDRKRPVSGPKATDPYAADDTSSLIIPVLVAIGAFLPILFCLCRL